MNLKKVTSLTLTAFLLLSFFTGCAGEGAGSSSAPEPSSSDTADTFAPSQNKREPERIDYDESTFPEVSFAAQHAELVIERAEQKVESYDAFFNNLAFSWYSDFTSASDYDSPMQWGVYDFKTKKFHQIAKLMDTTASTGSSVIMEERYYYTWWGRSKVDEKGNEVWRNDLLRIDAQEGNMNIVETRDDVHFLSTELKKLNEHTFVGISARWDGERLASGETKTTFLEKYDGKTGKREVIATEVFTCGKTDRNSSGINIEQICTMDGVIYAFGRRRENGVDKCYIYTYDENGNRLTETEYPELYAGFQENTRKFYVVGDYLIIESLEGLTDSLFKMENGELKLLFDYTSGHSFSISNNFWNSNGIKYIYYLEEKFNGNNMLHALNVTTGKTVKLKIEIDPEYTGISFFSVDENGNMVITLHKGEDFLDNKAYYLTAETLDQLIKSAS